MDKTIANIKNYLNIINPNIKVIDNENNGLIDFAINEVLDRVQLYLNSNTIPEKIERILANIVNNGIKRALKNIAMTSEDITATEQVITNISDNGQSIAYANEVMKYFSTASDEELFTGFTSLLARYRRIKVVYSKDND